MTNESPSFEAREGLKWKQATFIGFSDGCIRYKLDSVEHHQAIGSTPDMESALEGLEEGDKFEMLWKEFPGADYANILVNVRRSVS